MEISESDPNVYSSHTALQIIAHMWSLPNSDPPIWEFHCLRQCLLGSLQLFDDPEDQLTQIEEFSENGPKSNVTFGPEEVLHFMCSINNMQKNNPTYPALAEETTEDDFEITFHHFGLPIPFPFEIKECKDMCSQVTSDNLVTKNEAMMAWFAVLKRQQLHKGSKETLARIWSIFNPTGDAAVPFETFLMGVYYLLQKTRAVNFVLPFSLPENYYKTLRALFQDLSVKVNQVNLSMNENGNALDSGYCTMIDSRFMKFGESLIDRIADELLQNGLILGAPLDSKKGVKSPQKRNFNVAVRETMRLLLGWDPEDVESEVPTSVSAQQAEAYRAGRISGPGKNTFMIHWEKIGCDWNKRAAKIFADHFINLYSKGTFSSIGDFPKALIQPDNLIKVFMDKLHYLSDKRDTIIIQRKGSIEIKEVLKEENSIIAKRNRRRSRKVSIYTLRKGALSHFLTSNDYDSWAQMLTRLGADGMSSDETDEEIETSKARKVLRIPKPWRNQEIDILLKVLDNASLEPNMLGRKPKGHQRRRIR